MDSHGRFRDDDDDERQPLNKHDDSNQDEPYTDADTDANTRPSESSISTTSLILERLGDSDTLVSNGDGHFSKAANGASRKRADSFDGIDEPVFRHVKGVDKKWKRGLWLVGVLGVVGWLLALGSFVTSGSYKHSSEKPHDPEATSSRGSGRKVTLDQVQGGLWRPYHRDLSWIKGADGEDGLLLEREGSENSDYLVVEDVRDLGNARGHKTSDRRKTLMEQGGFSVDGTYVFPSKVWPSPDMKKVLVLSNEESNWRHSYTGRYWIFDVETQTGEALDPGDPDGRIQLATWSPTSNAIAFTRHNNMYIRQLSAQSVAKITKDGGPELFYGVPDWVYEEEVFSGNSATWWSEDGKYIAYLRTNESAVPTYPVQYFVKRPSGNVPEPGLENYPEVRNIKYPKAGAPNPVVHLQFFDVQKASSFSMEIEDDFDDDDRLITEVVWAGDTGQVLVKETNRESDKLKVVLVDVAKRTGRTVREENVAELDGGWFEVSQDTTYIPPDPDRGRKEPGYIDTIIHEGYDHLGYFTPLDSSEPIVLTKGKWEVVDAPSAIDLVNNLVYFVATKESSIQRHVYSVSLNASSPRPLTDTSEQGYYGVTFSTSAGYALLSYNGPGIPWQKVISTPSNPEKEFEHTVEENKDLAVMASKHELPLNQYGTVNIDGFELNYVEHRPPHFSEKQKKKYPVLFHLYGGPGSQTVDKKFTVDFQAYIASSLGYIVVTLDGRGTGFLGRETRCAVRGNIGHLEAKDQIAAAKMWSKKHYVDAERLAIWGWSYGGFMTLKTLEQDGGRTFKYGMAVAPVTDWRYYDSIYTERYMHTPQHNPEGYDNATISDVMALSGNVRFLVMHGVADDNVHFQNTLALLDRLDQAAVENYDVHFFPDSDHSIYFHNANRIVYDKLSNWLINAFNGEWLKTPDAKPAPKINWQ